MNSPHIILTTMSALPGYTITRWLLHHRDCIFSNLKLQKLLYYAQGWHLAIYDKPLFEDRLEAWSKGPVVPTIYRKYKRYKEAAINEVEAEPGVIPVYIQNHLSKIVISYGYEAPGKLIEMTHAESPWDTARGTLPPDAPSDEEITHEAMGAYFKSIAELSEPQGLTKDAIDELECGDGMTYSNLDDLMKDLDA